jgi:methyltransferase (TIGR00027 family)
VSDTGGEGERDGLTPSRTSQAVAVTRSGFSRPHSAGGDPDAQRRLCEGMSQAAISDQLASLAARTQFFDERVLEAIGAGTRQVVILGAGYDDRALRFRTPGVRFFELDHPATQADKTRRLAAMNVADGPVLAAADFSRDDVGGVLAAAGHQASQPSLFLAEGLLVYLDQPTCLRLLIAVRARAASGSTLAASLAIHRDGLDSARVLEVANSRRRTAATEPWVTILPAALHLDLLRQAGWQAAESIDASDLGTGAEPGRSLLATAHPAAGVSAAAGAAA